MREVMFYLIQWTWGLPQTLLGLFVYIKYRNCNHYKYECSIATFWNRRGGISLGAFIFARDERLLAHEYGHCIQSLILGPFYLLLVGIPSYIWCNHPYFRNKRHENNIPYESLYCERWATNIGRKYSLQEKIWK